MHLKDIMTRGVKFVSPEATLQEAARLMKECDIGILPVGSGNDLRGVITDRDITIRAVAEGRDPTLTKVREAITGDVVTCNEDQVIEEAAELMKDRQIRRVLVVNGRNEPVGIVSLGDISVHRDSGGLAGEVLEEVSVDRNAS